MKPIKPLLFGIVLLFAFVACDDVIEEEAAGSISGIVIDYVTMEAVDGAVVTTNPPSYSLITNADGSFVFEDMDEGDYMVSAQKYLYSKSSVNVNVSASKISGVIIQLEEEDGSTSAVQFTDIVPLDQAEDIDVDVTLSWAADTDGVSDVEYRLKVYDTNSAQPFIDVSSLTDTFYVAEDLAYNTTHFWQVTAYRNDHQIGQSVLWTFRTVSESMTSLFNTEYFTMIPYYNYKPGVLDRVEDIQPINTYLAPVGDQFFILREKPSVWNSFGWFD